MNRTTKKCKKCSEIHWSDEAHECPTPEYEAARDALVAAAAEADERGFIDEETGHHIER